MLVAAGSRVRLALEAALVSVGSVILICWLWWPAVAAVWTALVATGPALLKLAVAGCQAVPALLKLAATSLVVAGLGLLMIAAVDGFPLWRIRSWFKTTVSNYAYILCHAGRVGQGTNAGLPRWAVCRAQKEVREYLLALVVVPPVILLHGAYAHCRDFLRSLRPIRPTNT